MIEGFFLNWFRVQLFELGVWLLVGIYNGRAGKHCGLYTVRFQVILPYFQSGAAAAQREPKPEPNDAVELTHVSLYTTIIMKLQCEWTRLAQP